MKTIPIPGQIRKLPKHLKLFLGGFGVLLVGVFLYYLVSSSPMFGGAAAPSTSTEPASHVTKTKADLNSLVSSDGGKPLTEKGIQYGTTTDYGQNLSVDPINAGALVREWGEAGTGGGQFTNGETSLFDYSLGVTGVASDSLGNVYVADSSNNRIQKFDTAGNYLGNVGEPGTGVGQTTGVGAIAVDSNDNLIIMQNGRIQKFNSAGVPILDWTATISEQTSVRSFSMAVDPSDNLFIIGWAGDSVQKFSSTGTLLDEWGETGSGEGQFNFANGWGTSSMAVDSLGNVFVHDMYNYRIQKFNNNGDYQTEFGSLGRGDGQLGQRIALAIDSNDYLFVSDGHNQRVQKFTTAGTYLGQWGGNYYRYLDERIFAPTKISISPDGKLYVYDVILSRIIEFSTEQEAQPLSFIASGLSCGTLYHYRSFSTNEDGTSYGDDQTLTTSSCGPTVPAVTTTPSSSVGQTSATINGTVDVATVDASLLTTGWGSQGNEDGQFEAPVRVLTDNRGYVYVGDPLNNNVQKFNASGSYISKIEGLFVIAHDSSNRVYAVIGECLYRYSAFDFSSIYQGTQVFCFTEGTDPGEFDDTPMAMDIDADGNLYMLDDGNERVQKFNSNGTFISSWTIAGLNINVTTNLTLDSQDNVYLTSYNTSRVYKFEKDGTPITNWGSIGEGDGQFIEIGPTAVDAFDNIYVVDGFNNRVQKFTSDGQYMTQWGSSADSPGSGSNELHGPYSVAVGPSGKVYIADYLNHRIQVIDSSPNTRGFQIERTVNYDIAKTTHEVEGPMTGTISFDLDGLACGTEYSYRVFATNTLGTSYGDTFTFTTEPCVDMPIVTTLPADNINKTKARFKGVVVDSTSINVTQRGFEYGTTVDYGSTVSGGLSDKDSFNATQTLVCETEYHYRAYATNPVGTGYGEDRVFTTASCSSPPNVVTNETDSTTRTTSIFNGTVNNVNQDGVFERGFRYGTTDIYGQQASQELELAPAYAGGWGSFGSNAGSFREPTGITTDSSGNIYVADMGSNFGNNGRIQKFNPDGTPDIQWVATGTSPSTFGLLEGMTTDSQDKVYVVDRSNGKVIRFNPDGTFNAQINISGGGYDVAVDSEDNIFVARGDAILKFNYSGTLLGQWDSYDGGDEYFLAVGIDVDVNDNVYVISDRSVMKFDTDGNPLALWDGNEDYSFNSPKGVSVDANGNVYVSDEQADKVLKFDPYGNYITEWNGSGASGGQFNGQQQVHVGADDAIYVTDTGNSRIQKFEALVFDDDYELPISGLVCATTYHYQAYAINAIGTGYGDDETFTTDECYVTPVIPTIVTDPATDITDTAVTLNGTISDVGSAALTSSGFNYGLTTSYGSTQSVAGNPQSGSIELDVTGLQCGVTYHFRAYAVNNAGTGYGDDRALNTGACDVSVPVVTTQDATSIGRTSGALRGTVVEGKQTISERGFRYGTTSGYGQTLSEAVSQAPAYAGKQVEPSELSSAQDMAVDSQGNTYVITNSGGSERRLVKKFNNSGNLVTQWGTTGSSDEQLQLAISIAIDSNDNVYVSDTFANYIKKYDSDGGYITKWGGTGSSPGQLIEPQGLAIDVSNNVYVADYVNHRVQRFNQAGVGVVVAGTGSMGDGDGEFTLPSSVAVSPDNKIYVADAGNNRIQIFDAAGTFIDKWGISGTGDGEFTYINDITIDSDGFVYVTDSAPEHFQTFDSLGNHIATWSPSDEFMSYGYRSIATDPNNPGTILVSAYFYGVEKFVAVDQSAEFVLRANSLTCGVTYHYQAYATNAAGTGYGQDKTMTTDACPAAPTVTTNGASDVTTVAADVSGTVTSELGTMTSRGFRYGTTTGYGKTVSSPVEQGWAYSGQITPAIEGDEALIGGIAGSVRDSQGNTYVIDDGAIRIRKYNPAGELELAWGSFGFDNDQFLLPSGIAVDSNDDVYVADLGPGVIKKFDDQGGWLDTWGVNGEEEGQLISPRSIAFNAQGQLYVADIYRNKILKFEADGDFIREWGGTGTNNGQFTYITDIAVSADGDVYVTNGYNGDESAVRTQKFDEDGGFIAKWGLYGEDQGEFFSSTSISLDAAGDVYIVDYGYGDIQKFDNEGNYLDTISSDQDYLFNVDIDASNVMSVLAYDRITNQGNIQTLDQIENPGPYTLPLDNLTCGTTYHFQAFAINGIGTGRGDDQAFTTPTCDAPIVTTNPTVNITKDTAVLDGTVTDRGSSDLVVIGWQYGETVSYGQTVIGTVGIGQPFDFYENIADLECETTYHVRAFATNDEGTGYGLDEEFTTKDCPASPVVITNNATDPTQDGGTFNGTIASVGTSELTDRGFEYGTTTSYGQNVIEYPNTQRAAYEGVFGEFGSSPTQLYSPWGLAYNSEGYLFVVDSANHRVKKYRTDGTQVLGANFGSLGTEEGEFNYPFDITIDDQDNMYVTDSENYRIQKFSSDGTFITMWGEFGSGNGQFRRIDGIEVDSQGNVYVSDGFNDRIQKFTSDGEYILQWGAEGDGDGQFSVPTGIAVDSSDFVYVADRYNHRIQKFNSKGDYVLEFGSQGSGDGQLEAPAGITIDSNGSIYITDTHNYRIKKHSSDGSFDYYIDGINGGYGPASGTGIAINDQGELFVADTQNHTIAKFQTIPQTGPFEMDVSGLECETTYHYRAFASNNSGGGATGADKTLTTADCPGTLPSVTTTPASEITRTTATLNGIIDDAGSEPITAISFEYGLTTSYGITVSVDAVQDGGFEYDISDLTCGTTYYYQASATNGVGTSDGGQQTFETSDCPITLAPTATTDSQDFINSTTGTLNGTVTDLGTSPVTERGFRYGTSSSYGNTVGDPMDPIFAYAGKWGSEGAGESQFGSPRGIEVDALGNTYIVDTDNDRIQKFNSDGEFQIEWGATGSGQGEFNRPTDIAYTNGLLYVTDSNNHRVQIFNMTGDYQGEWNTTFQNPYSIAINDYGVVILTNESIANADKIEVSSTDGTLYGQVSGASFEENSFTRAYATLFDINTNKIYIATDQNKIIVLSSMGEFIDVWGETGSGNGQFQTPNDISVDANGVLFVTDSGNNRIQSFTPQGEYLGQFGSTGSDNGQLQTPARVAFDGNDIYVLDFGNSRVQKFSLVQEVGPYSFDISDLTCGTTYHYQAFATNEVGTGRGIDRTFATTACPSAPSVSTQPATAITKTSATLNGTVTSAGTQNLTSRGFQYGKSTSYGSTLSESTGSTGVYNRLVTKLDCETTYNYRAYATNSVGTSYGVNRSFKTAVCPLPPEVVIIAPTNNQVFGATTTSVDLVSEAISKTSEIERVDYYVDDVYVGTVETAPYTMTALGLPVGTHVLVAKAYDVLGATTTADPVTFYVEPPVTEPETTTTTVVPDEDVSDSGTNPIIKRDTIGTTGVSPVAASWVDNVFGHKVFKAVPLLLILLLLAMALMYARRAFKEYMLRSKIQQTIKRYESTLQSTNEYLAITSHYLNTPVAIMGGAVELVASLRAVPESTIKNLQTKLKAFGKSVEDILVTNQSSAAKSNYKAPELNPKTKSIMLDPAVWIPSSITLICLIAANLLFINVGVLTNSLARMIIEFSLFVLAFLLLVLSKRYIEVSKATRKLSKDELNTKANLFNQRRDFIDSTRIVLEKHYSELKVAGERIKSVPQARLYNNGLKMVGDLMHGLESLHSATELTKNAPLFAVTSFAKRLVSDYQHQAAEHDVEIKSEVEEGITVRIQPEEMRQLFSSLVDNAIKFNKPGGTVKVNARKHFRKISLSVSDNGQGISPEKLDKLFQPFSRATDSMQFDYEGAGLNLYINKVIVSRLGGTMGITSEVGKGTTVTVTLPSVNRQDALITPDLVVPTVTPDPV